MWMNIASLSLSFIVCNLSNFCTLLEPCIDPYFEGFLCSLNQNSFLLNARALCLAYGGRMKLRETMHTYLGKKTKRKVYPSLGVRKLPNFQTN